MLPFSALLSGRTLGMAPDQGPAQGAPMRFIAPPGLGGFFGGQLPQAPQQQPDFWGQLVALLHGRSFMGGGLR
jgi:hypothetical protein